MGVSKRYLNVLNEGLYVYGIRIRYFKFISMRVSMFIVKVILIYLCIWYKIFQFTEGFYVYGIRYFNSLKVSMFMV